MNDVWDTANEVQLGPKVYFGQVFTDAFFVHIAKGEPKVPFDAAQHKPETKFTQIKIDGVCTRANGSTYDISREIIAEFGREWAGIVLPSLKVCGVHPRDLNERWARWEMVSTGRKYTNSAGEEREASTFKFLEFFDSEDACRAAEKAHYSRPVEDEEDAPLPMPEENTNVNGNAERANLAKFLPLLWTQAAGDVVKFGELLQANPILAAQFDLNSPEVQAVIK